MSFSAYQIESLLEDIQKNILPIEKSSSDTLSISEDAFNDSRQLFSLPKSLPLGTINPEMINDLIEDKTTYDPIVDYVQQSRAGRFVTPNYIPKNPAPPFSLVSDFSQSKKEFDRQKIDNSPNSLSNNLSKETINDIIEQELKDVSQKGIKQNEENNINEEKSTKLKNLNNNSSTGQLFKDIENEELLEDSESFYRELSREIDGNNDVVFGEGPILINSISRFVSDYPESAIKFLLRKNIDGRPLPIEYEKIYQKWEERGLTRGKLKKYLLKLMKWEDFPDMPVLEILRTIREYLFDIKAKKDE